MEKKKRGFACMSREQVQEISRKGGIAAHANGTAHKFTKEEAREAGRKGGRRSRSTAASAALASWEEEEKARQ